MDIYQKTEQFVRKSFAKKGGDMKHFIRTVYWVKRLHPEAGQNLLIAAVSHDIERAFRSDSIEHAQNSEKGFLDEKHLKDHQEKGAQIIFDFLAREGASEEFAGEVKSLVARHEVGGTKEQNVLKDADSVSFFENNTEHFISEKAGELGKEKVKEKFDWMFSRISSSRAKEIARPWYESGIKRLGY